MCLVKVEVVGLGGDVGGGCSKVYVFAQFCTLSWVEKWDGCGILILLLYRTRVPEEVAVYDGASRFCWGGYSCH